MRFKIKFDINEKYIKMFQKLEELNIYDYVTNIERNIILIEELPKSVIKAVDEIGGEISIDKQYNLEIQDGKVLDEDGKVIGEQG